MKVRINGIEMKERIEILERKEEYAIETVKAIGVLSIILSTISVFVLLYQLFSAPDSLVAFRFFPIDTLRH